MKLRRHALTSLFALLVLAVALLCGCSAAGSAESAHFTETEPRGEFVLVVAGKS